MASLDEFAAQSTSNSALNYSAWTSRTRIDIEADTGSLGQAQGPVQIPVRGVKQMVDLKAC